VHQIRFRPGPRTPLGELSALPRPLAGLKGPTSKAEGEEEKKRKGRDIEERREEEGMGWEIPRPSPIPGYAPVKSHLSCTSII